MKRYLYLWSIIIISSCTNTPSTSISTKDNQEKKEQVQSKEQKSSKSKDSSDKENNQTDPLNFIRQIDFDSKKMESSKEKVDTKHYTISQPPSADAKPNATVLNPDVRIATPKKGGSPKMVIAKDGAKGQDYSHLPNFSKDYKPSEVTEACLFNLAGGRMSEARKFTNDKIAKSMRLNGGDGGPIIKNLKVNILEEKIEGDKAYIKFEDSASDYFGYHTLTHLEGKWIITDTKSEKK